MNALNIKHTRAHQGLARVYHLKRQRKDAYDEMTKLIEKAWNNASAYEKRSEYCDRDIAKSDLNMATHLDPLRTYPYRYRAAGESYTSGSKLFFVFLLGCEMRREGTVAVIVTIFVFQISIVTFVFRCIAIFDPMLLFT